MRTGIHIALLALSLGASAPAQARAQDGKLAPIRGVGPDVAFAGGGGVGLTHALDNAFLGRLRLGLLYANEPWLVAAGVTGEVGALGGLGLGGELELNHFDGPYAQLGLSQVQQRDSQSHLVLGYTLFGVEWQQRFTHAGVSHALLGEIRVPLGMWWFLVGHDKDKHDRRKRAAAATGSNFSSPSSRVQAAAAASTPGPSDDDRLAAEKALERARDDSARGNYALAADALSRAYALDPDPLILLRLADADEKQGKLVAASRELQRFLRAAQTPEATEHNAQVTARMQALQLRLAQLRLTCPDAHGDETVLVDNEPAPGALLGYDVPLDPGSHALLITRAGAELLRRNVVVEEGKILRLELSLAPQPAPALPVPPSEPHHD